MKFGLKHRANCFFHFRSWGIQKNSRNIQRSGNVYEKVEKRQIILYLGIYCETQINTDASERSGTLKSHYFISNELTLSVQYNLYAARIDIDVELIRC